MERRLLPLDGVVGSPNKEDDDDDFNFEALPLRDREAEVGVPALRVGLSRDVSRLSAAFKALLNTRGVGTVAVKSPFSPVADVDLRRRFGVVEVEDDDFGVVLPRKRFGVDVLAALGTPLEVIALVMSSKLAFCGDFTRI